MKSEHRHDLQTNDLSKVIAQAGEFLQKNGQSLLIGLVAVIALVIAIAVYSSRSDTESAESWARLAAARLAEDYAKVADDYDGTSAGAWARLQASELNLEQGIQVAFTNRPNDIAEISELKQAKKGFDSLLSNSSVPSTVRERALLGMARYLETTCDGNTDQAIRAYKQFVSEFKNSSQKRIAEERIEALGTQSAQEFYAWFYDQHPKPLDREMPNDGFHGTGDSVDLNIGGIVDKDAADNDFPKLPSDIRDFMKPDETTPGSGSGGLPTDDSEDSKEKPESDGGDKTDKKPDETKSDEKKSADAKPETEDSKNESDKSTDAKESDTKETSSGPADKDASKADESDKPAAPK